MAMRESRRTEKMHLPRDSGEEWLDLQKPRAMGEKHRKPPANGYEAWLEKRVQGSGKPTTTVRKRMGNKVAAV